MCRIDGEAENKPNPVEGIGRFPPGAQRGDWIDAVDEEPQPATQGCADEDVPHRDGEIVRKASGIENPRGPPLRFDEEKEVGEECGKDSASPEKEVTVMVSDVAGFHGGKKLGLFPRKFNLSGSRSLESVAGGQELEAVDDGIH